MPVFATIVSIFDAYTTPPLVCIVVKTPLAVIIRPTGFGLLAVTAGTSAIAPVFASVVIEAVPRLSVLPERYKSLQRKLAEPKS